MQLYASDVGLGCLQSPAWSCYHKYYKLYLTHCGRVTQICVFNTVKLGTSASSP